MTDSPELLDETAEDLFESAPCGYISTRLDGTIVRVNRTFEELTGRPREELLAGTRFQTLLSPGGRIYHETHYAPLLRMQGAVREIAVEIVRADGTRLPALINSRLVNDSEGEPSFIRTTIFDATDRRRYEDELLRARREHEAIALDLQRSLLGGVLPQAPGFAVEVAYRAAIRGTEVGGDWYDAFWLRTGETVALVVGDVVGRGLEAAATMGQLRSAVRALATTGLAPGPLLGALDAYAERYRVGAMATVLYAELDLAARVLHYACAGHPPPVISGSNGTSLSWEGRSTPLTVFAGKPEPRAEATVELTPEALVLLYTDGLVERRKESLTESLDRLVAAVDERRDLAPDALVPELLRAIGEPDSKDDVCVLAVRLD